MTKTPLARLLDNMAAQRAERQSQPRLTATDSQGRARYLSPEETVQVRARLNDDRAVREADSRTPQLQKGKEMPERTPQGDHVRVDLGHDSLGAALDTAHQTASAALDGLSTLLDREARLRDLARQQVAERFPAVS